MNYRINQTEETQTEMTHNHQTTLATLATFTQNKPLSP